MAHDYAPTRPDRLALREPLRTRHGVRPGDDGRDTPLPNFAGNHGRPGEVVGWRPASRWDRPDRVVGGAGFEPCGPQCVRPML